MVSQGRTMKKTYKVNELPESFKDFIKFKMTETRPIEECVTSGSYYLWLYRNRHWLSIEKMIEIKLDGKNCNGISIKILTDSIGEKGRKFKF